MKPRLALTEAHLVLKGVDDFQLNLFWYNKLCNIVGNVMANVVHVSILW